MWAAQRIVILRIQWDWSFLGILVPHGICFSHCATAVAAMSILCAPQSITPVAPTMPEQHKAGEEKSSILVNYIFVGKYQS